MSSKTKIVVLHMKELIYTGIFVALGILFIILLVIMFLPGKDDSDKPPAGTPKESAPSGESDAPDNAGNADAAAASSDGLYIPGIYTTQLILNDQAIDVEVIVDKDRITSLRLVNLNEAVTTMYPLLAPTFDALCEQIYEKQSVSDITYASESKYTSLVLLEAIRSSLEKAAAGDVAGTE